MFGWTLGVWDTDRPGADVIRRRARKGVRPGTVLLLHDGDGYNPSGDRRQTMQALVGIIEDPPDARGRVGVLMDILRAQTRVSIDADSLEDA